VMKLKEPEKRRAVRKKEEAASLVWKGKAVRN